ncbi:MAG: hypothetical protein ACLGHN_05965 [Bacteriovoracia bacterium]
MKNLKLILLSLFSLSIVSNVGAQALEAKSFIRLLELIDKSEFTYKERGMVFGYNTIQSCLFVSQDLVIFKNYCFPQRDYPARGYTIISAEYGMIDLYEEKFPTVLKRDIIITEFPEILRPYLTTPFPVATLSGLSDMMEKMYHRYYPACWSTNFSFYSETAEAACTVSSSQVSEFENWKNETQEMVLDVDKWALVLDSIESKLSQYQQ